MKTIEISIDWIMIRAEEEKLAMSVGILSKIKFLFLSQEKIDEIKENATKSLGKIEMLREIMETFIKSTN